MQHYKLNITEIPNQIDGIFELFAITQEENTTKFPVEYLTRVKDSRGYAIKMYYEELSISDKFKFDLEQKNKKISVKIRITQTKEITTENVLKIGDTYHKVYNVYHFTNKSGFKQTDLTLEQYINPKIKED